MRRAHQEGHVRVFGGHFAGLGLGAEDFADDQVIALFGIFPHHARIVGVGGVFRIGIGDVATILCRDGGDMDAADPLLLDRYGVDARDFQRFGGQSFDRGEGGKGADCGA